LSSDGQLLRQCLDAVAETMVEDQVEDRPVTPKSSPTGPDRVFRTLATTGALVSLGVVLVTLFFLFDKARPAFRDSGIIHFFTKSTWLPATGQFGVLGMLENTVIIALVALAVAVPTSLSMALFINEYAPRRVKQAVTSVVDLLAALPSLLFGIWGFYALEAPEIRIAKWMNHHLSVLPWFRLASSTTTLAASTFDAGVVVGIMIIPIITSISRDVMGQVPREQCEGALALGGTRWGMIRDVILPFGRSGIIGGVILGLGRALGETIAILFIITIVFPVNTHILSGGSGSIAAIIANLFGNSNALGRSGLIAAGLCLFVLTLIVNFAARYIVARSGRFS
jgi:phosphate transport system permease protein